MILISHRGASGYAPENTKRAFEVALEMGCLNFEFDVQMTKDGKLIAHHDYNLKRTAGLDLSLKDLTFDELKKINIARYFNSLPECPPLIEEILDIIGTRADLINFEIKNDGGIYPGIGEKTLDVIKRRKIMDRSLISSFHYPTVLKIRSLDKEVRMGYLIHGLKSAFLGSAIKEAKKINAESFHMNRKVASAGNIKRIHKEELAAYIYTVNSAEEARKLEAAGADGIFTNFPDLMEKG